MANFRALRRQKFGVLFRLLAFVSVLCAATTADAAGAAAMASTAVTVPAATAQAVTAIVRATAD